MVFEDETCSIWTCRYESHAVFAPHEHGMDVHIAFYRGAEVEVLYKRELGELRHGGNSLVKQGDVVRLGPEAIHAITADGDEQSIAIHVYEGPLTRIERSLFDWTTGEEVEFTMENFHAMAHRKEDMKEFKSCGARLMAGSLITSEVDLHPDGKNSGYLLVSHSGHRCACGERRQASTVPMAQQRPASQETCHLDFNQTGTGCPGRRLNGTLSTCIRHLHFPLG